MKDLISRQAVLDLIADYDLSMGQVVRGIHALQSVTPQPKIGRWIDDKCSVCGKGIEDLIDSYEWYRNEKPNFCPFCGLRLVDSQESEEEE